MKISITTTNAVNGDVCVARFALASFSGVQQAAVRTMTPANGVFDGIGVPFARGILR